MSWNRHLAAVAVLVFSTSGCSDQQSSATGSGAAPSDATDPKGGAEGVDESPGEEGSAPGGSNAGPVGTGGVPGSGGSSTGAGGSPEEEPPGPGTSACDADAIVVSSIEALLPYLDASDVSVQLAPGTYRVDNATIEDLSLDAPFQEGDAEVEGTVFEVTGDNSTFCFTGATIEFDTEIFQAFGNINVTELYINGSGNALKNLTMVDIGETRPYRTALGIHDKGTENLIEGFHLTIRGSEPYGYGDIYGKGVGYAIKHFKHSGILLTGDDHHLKDITMIHRAYGHGIFMQGAIGVLLEGIYMEGELRTTDEILAEEGTSAAERNFEPVWGGELQPGYRFSLQEDGIRAYRRAANGRISADITVRDSVVKFMRSGVTIGLGEGPQYVENVTSLGCESGFYLGGGDGQVVNSRGDASVGPLYSEGNPKRGNMIELTLLDSVVPKLGNIPAVYLAGNAHELVLKDGTTSFDPNLELFVSGPRNNHRADATPEDANGITFDNRTPYPLVLWEGSFDSTVSSCGPVTDNGADNGVSNTECETAD